MDTDLLSALDLFAEELTGYKLQKWKRIREKLLGEVDAPPPPDLFRIDLLDGTKKEITGWMETATFLGLKHTTLRCVMSTSGYCVVRKFKKIGQVARVTRPHSVRPDHPELSNFAFDPNRSPEQRQADADKELAYSKGWDPRIHGTDYTQFLPRPKFVRKPPAKK